jgi:flagellar biosynthesis/type III secretory pathway ATPase
MAAHRQASDLIDVGAYSPGANPRVDRALKVLPAVRRFLQQSPQDPRGELPATVAALRAALELKEGDRA